MKTIEKVILLVCVSLMLASCGSSRKALTLNSGVQNGFICTGMNGNGDLIVKSTAVGNNRDVAFDNALRGVVDAMLFTGIEGDVQNRVNFQQPLVGKASVNEEGRAYFDNFFSQGMFRQYASAVPTIAPSYVKTGNGYKAIVYFVVKKNNLRRELEKNGIIKSMQNIFN